MITCIVSRIVQDLTAGNLITDTGVDDHMVDVAFGCPSSPCIIDCLGEIKIGNIAVIITDKIVQQVSSFGKGT